LKADDSEDRCSVNAPQPPNCWACRHLRVTWEPSFPYACNAMGFKSRNLPCVEVLLADGEPCRAFSAKPAAAAPDKTPAG